MYVVTGGAGFIGSHIVDALLTAGEKVRVLDDFSNGFPENLQAAGDRAELIRGDVRDADVVRRAIEGAAVVLHLAALGSVQRSVDDPLASNDVNVHGTLNVLLAARDCGVRRVVFSSSSSVYGDNAVLPKREDLAAEPISPYAVSKLAAENYTRVFSRVYGIETVCLRYFNVFGPRQRPDSLYAAVIPRFLRWAWEGRPLAVYGDGLQSRDFTYVDNVVSANLLAARTAGVGGRVLNIACGARYSLLDIVDSLERIIGHKLEREHREARRGDVRHSQADIGAAREALGFQVRVDFHEGLRRTWQAFLASPSAQG